MTGWAARDADVCWHPYTQHAIDRDPLPVVGARGSTLQLADGRCLIDAISSWWTCLHGHAHPRLIAAMTEQAERLDHVLFAGCTHEPAVRLAETLVDLARPLRAPEDGGLARVFYSDDGSTAVEVALKAAYLAWVRRGERARTTFIALEWGYHGDTFGAMAVGDPDPFFRDLAPLLFDVVRVRADPDALAAALREHRGKVAAVILEPLVQGAAGMEMHPASFVRDARRLCDEDGVFLIADEVMTGFGRTGTVFACEQAGIAPDLLCAAKGLTGTFPLAVTLATEEIYRIFLSEDRERCFFHGHSFTASPIGCAVALASMAILREEGTPARLDRIGRRIEAGLAELPDRIAGATVRRTGGIVAVELAADDAGYLAATGERLRAACRTRDDVLLRPLGNVVYALTPSCLTDEETDRVATAMAEVAMAAAAE